MKPSKCICFIIIHQVGKGDVVADGALVIIHYEMYQEGFKFSVDSTYQRRKPHHFRLGKGCVIPGLEAIVRTMRVSEVREAYLEPAGAFGGLAKYDNENINKR